MLVSHFSQNYYKAFLRFLRLEKEDYNRPASYVKILENPPICDVPVTSSSDECQFVCYIIDNFLQTNTSNSD